jgi:uncharacterized protein (DUF1697 family)
MTTYVVFVRAVNVGGHNRLPMPAFREILGALGYIGVTTYLQSGNALFTAPRQDTAALEEEIEGALAAGLGLAVTVMVRTTAELAALVAANPLPAAAGEPARLHVAFLAGAADPDRISAGDLSRFAPDEVRPGERALYIWYRNGVGRSKLTTAVLEKRVGGPVTARNWKTVTALLGQARAGE